LRFNPDRFLAVPSMRDTKPGKAFPARGGWPPGCHRTYGIELQGVLIKRRILYYSLDHVVEIRAEVRRGVEVLEKEIETLKLEVVVVIEAQRPVGFAYRKARVILDQAADRQDNAAQAKAYEEAEHLHVAYGEL
jgi:hypothetical protein